MKIEIWYDSWENSWVIQIKDENDFLVGDTEYVYSKREALDRAKVLSYEKEIPVIKVFKRNGDYHRDV